MNWPVLQLTSTQPMQTYATSWILMHLIHLLWTTGGLDSMETIVNQVYLVKQVQLGHRMRKSVKLKLMSCCWVLAQFSRRGDAEASQSKAEPVLPQCCRQKEQQTTNSWGIRSKKRFKFGGGGGGPGHWNQFWPKILGMIGLLKVCVCGGSGMFKND